MLTPVLSCLVLSCFFRVHPLGGLFLAHAEAGLHCTVQSITPPWAGCSGLMHLNHLRGIVRLLHETKSFGNNLPGPCPGNVTPCCSARRAVIFRVPLLLWPIVLCLVPSLGCVYARLAFLPLCLVGGCFCVRPSTMHSHSAREPFTHDARSIRRHVRRAPSVFSNASQASHALHTSTYTIHRHAEASLAGWARRRVWRPWRRRRERRRPFPRRTGRRWWSWSWLPTSTTATDACGWAR